MARANRLYDAWLGLEAADRNNADAVKAIGPARRLFLDWLTSDRRRPYYEPLAVASPPVREAVAPLRALAATCSPDELAEFISLAKGAG
jgi:hypothetical protein